MGLTSDFAWWQLWTCHLAHWDARHLLLNIAAAIPPLLFVSRARALAIAFLAAPVLSLAILAFGLDGEYRGASGLVVLLWVYAALTRRNAFLLAAIAAKLLIESAGWWPSDNASYTALPLAHYAGALLGVIAALTGKGNMPAFRPSSRSSDDSPTPCSAPAHLPHVCRDDHRHRHGRRDRGRRPVHVA